MTSGIHKGMSGMFPTIAQVSHKLPYFPHVLILHIVTEGAILHMLDTPICHKAVTHTMDM